MGAGHGRFPLSGGLVPGELGVLSNAKCVNIILILKYLFFGFTSRKGYGHELMFLILLLFKDHINIYAW